MAISHVKSNIVPDWTGTVTVGNSTGGTQTIAATDLVRPADWNSAHNQFYTLSGNTNGASTASGTNVVLSGGNNVTLIGGGATVGISVGNYITTGALSNHSHGNPTLALTNLSGTTASNSAGLTLSLSAAAPGGGAAVTKSGYAPMADSPFVVGQVGQGTLQFQPEGFPNVQFDRVAFQIHNSNSSNSSGSHTLSFWVGLYTRNASTLSLWGSTSTTVALTHSGTVGSYSLYSGIRHVTIPWTTTVSEDNYWIGFVSRTTSGGANGRYSNLVMSNVNSNFVGHFGSSHNTTQQLTLGQGVYSATTSSLPNSVAFTQIRGSDSAVFRFPNFFFASGTV